MHATGDIGTVIGIDIGTGIDTGLAADALVVCVAHSQVDAHKEKEEVSIIHEHAGGSVVAILWSLTKGVHASDLLPNMMEPASPARKSKTLESLFSAHHRKVQVMLRPA